MSKKHLWSKKEDELLIKLKHDLKMHKWVEIAQTINSHFEGQTLTGKQCRDRYINKLSQHLHERDWEVEEDLALMKLLGTYGRRWSLIAQRLSGRSQNSIKNHFYARLRRSVRELDKYIKRQLSSCYSTVDGNFLNKILSISAHKFSDNGSEDELRIEKANEIIQFLFWRADFSEPMNNRSSEVDLKIQLIQYLGGVSKIEETLKKQENEDDEPYHYFVEPPQQIKVEVPPFFVYNPYCFFYYPYR